MNIRNSVSQVKRGKNLTILQIMQSFVQSKKLRQELSKLSGADYVEYCLRIEELKSKSN